MSDSPLINRRHLDFLLYDVLEAESLCRYRRFAEHSRETFDSAIELAHQIAVDHFLPINRKGDAQEAHVVDGRVEVIPEARAALDAYVGAGFMAELADEADGGMQLPYLISLALDGMFTGANFALSGFTLLTRGAANLLHAHGSADQQRRYMRPMIEGRWFGTMCLSEPQAGSSLADIRCVAEPAADGRYRLRGAKQWISGGDHEVAENIVHLVLARLPGAPAGVKGISLFIVPRYRVDAAGRRGARNDVKLAGLNHKLGQRVLPNCLLKFGEDGECDAELVGEAHQGLAYMFHMMNEARIGVGLGAIQLGWCGYLYSLAYARERLQGRHADVRDAGAAPVPIIEHADVRRMLLQQKVYVEGAHALALFAALQVDIAAQDPNAAIRGEAALLLDFLTPIVKSWSSEWCLKANELAIQVLGGYGCTREYPVEQHYRDNRINPIHEGTNGIQAIDLMGRKSTMQNGAALRVFLSRVASTAQSCVELPALRDHAASLHAQLRCIDEAVTTLAPRMGGAEQRATLGNAQYYMHLVGHTAIAWMWLLQARCSVRLLAKATQADEAFHRGKLQACAFFFRTELPQTAVSAALLRSGDRSHQDMQADGF